jgi:hypothetical protein
MTPDGERFPANRELPMMVFVQLVSRHEFSRRRDREVPDQRASPARHKGPRDGVVFAELVVLRIVERGHRIAMSEIGIRGICGQVQQDNRKFSFHSSFLKRQVIHAKRSNAAMPEHAIIVKKINMLGLEFFAQV